MIINKIFKVDGTQAYTVTAGDVIVVKVKGSDEFRYKVPDNFKGTITINITGALTEIEPN
ncbi:MAG: hypothetical protein V1709_10305 [Planctomycetota bacterium]